MFRIVLVVFLAMSVAAASGQRKAGAGTYTLKSPDGKLSTIINTRGNLSYTLMHERDTIIAPSHISMKLSGGEVLGQNAVVSSAKTNTANTTIPALFYKRDTIRDNYNELVLDFRNGYSIVWRAYNEGLAYRFMISRKTAFTVENEEVNFNFSSDYTAVLPYVNKKTGASFEEQFFNSFENTYTFSPLSKLDSRKLAFLPLVVAVSNGKKVCITEADLESYPGMYLNNKGGTNSLVGVFAPYPKTTEQGGHNNLQNLVKGRENFIAKSNGARSFPWRVLAVSQTDKELTDNDLVYKLASPSRVPETSWIRPGKVAWDWWNDWNIKGVDFKSGVNNQTYKYYIDFASKYNMEYVILDEGWAVNMKADLMQVVPEIDIKELVDYARERNVGIILWAGYTAFDKDMEAVASHYAGLGVKGFKIDFMDRDDQEMVNFFYRASATCAKYKLLADFHGAYKPTGLNRTYPNVLNFEGVHGLEQMKWSADSVDQVSYDVTIPFIRMLAGPMDYTQGAMRNAIKKNYHPVNSDPMSQGTRCRQLAQYVVFESPLNMLCDNPSNYIAEPECTKFISSVPKVWDETIALNGELGKYVSIARKKGSDWYIGSLTNWDPRELVLDLSFLDQGTFKAEIFADGVNADKNATDYKHNTIDIPADRKLKINLAPGGGYTARIFAQ
jgi:alpha-glucosidase